MSLSLDGEKGFGELRNIGEVVNMEDFSLDQKINHALKLWSENPIKYAEWVSLCIELGDLVDFFYVPKGLSLKLGEGFSSKGKESSNQKNKKISIFLKKQDEESFSIVDQSIASHVLEQIFDDEGDIVLENLKLNIL
jgi:hypothetical protein